MQQPLVSVIIPAFNVARYIEETLASVCQQTYKNLEIIVINDGSTDRTLSALSRIIDSRLHVIDISNHGVSYARNLGINKAKGEIIAFLDGDDVWHERHIETAVLFFERNPSVQWHVSSWRAATEIQNMNWSSEQNNDRILNFFNNGHLKCWSSVVTIRKSAIFTEALFPVGISQGEDTIAWITIGNEHAQLGYSPLITAMYRQRENSAVHSRKQLSEKLIADESIFYHHIHQTKAFHRLSASRSLRAWSLFSDSWHMLIQNTSLTRLQQEVWRYSRNSGIIPSIYISIFITLRAVLDAIFSFPLYLFSRVYKKLVSLSVK